MKSAVIIVLAIWVAALLFAVVIADHRIVQLECALAQAHAEADMLEAMLREGD